MIYYEPIPLLEANLFLANYAADISWSTYLERGFGKGWESRDETFRSYSRILLQLERRLMASITVSEDVIQTLYAPLNQKGHDDAYPSSDYLCNLLLPNSIMAYAEWGPSVFFNNIRKTLDQVPNAILNFLNPSADADLEINIQELFSKINASNLPSRSKLALTDLALNTSQYVDLMQETLLPVAEELERCHDLSTPLITYFRECYREDNEDTLLDKYWPGDRENLKEVFVYPSIVCSNYTIFAFDDSRTKLLSCIGVLCKYMNDNPTIIRDAGPQLSKVIKAPSNWNRFSIVTKLLDGPAFGRELAEHTGLSHVTISQHISILMSANIVTVHNDGVRTYYSLNTETLRKHVDVFTEYFKL